MGIDWYAASRERQELYELGSRPTYHCAMEAAIEMRASSGVPPPKWSFVLAVVASAQYGAARELPDEDVWWHDFYVAAQASNLYDFCEWAQWDVTVVNDCDDSLFKLPGRYRVTRSVFSQTTIDRSFYGTEVDYFLRR